MAAPLEDDAVRISIYLRVRPVTNPASKVEIEADEGQVAFTLPRDAAGGYVNNSRENYAFKFDGIFDAEAKQDVIFERTSHKVVVGALDGINGTIFAYGQTGSGKTFTITGGATRYADRGIIPRAISLIFKELSQRSDWTYTVHFSYLEIYNEQGYDLLDPTHEDSKSLEDLPKVTLMEDEDKQIHLRNLSAHPASNEEEALNLLFLGDTNRMISATPMNQASTRGHCIFTASIEARKAGHDMVRRSKLHLVDLAGSERVSKTHVDGLILKEAKYINLSLHFLEQVIVALQERSQGKARSHVPYRNSMMTSVLRDSLGGNCRTVMIATVNTSAEQLEETISTCRFAQRVAQISNQVYVNEELDPVLVIRRLKQEIRDLKEELRLLKGDDADRGPITESEIEQIGKQIERYVQDPSPEAALNVGTSMMHIRAAFELFKKLCKDRKVEKRAAAAGAPNPEFAKGVSGRIAVNGTVPESKERVPEATAAEAEEVKKLRLQLKQRDNEVNILVAMLKGRGVDGAEALLQSRTHAPEATEAQSKATKPPTGPLSEPVASPTGTERNGAEKAGRGGVSSVAAALIKARATSPTKGAIPEASARATGAASDESARAPAQDLSLGLLADRNKAFEMFRKSYRKNEVIEENKAILKAKYTEAKALGETVNAAREHINGLKSRIEQRRMKRAMAAVADGGDPSALPPDPEEEALKHEIDEHKGTYKDGFARLRDLKKEIEHLQMILEQSRVRLQADFEQWLNIMARQQQPGAHTAARPTSPLGESNANLLGNSREPAASLRSTKAARADVGAPDERAERASRPLSAPNRSAREKKEAPFVGDDSRRRDGALSPSPVESPGQSFARAPRSAWGAGGSAASTPSAFQASDVASPASSAAFSPSSFPAARAHENQEAPQSSRFDRRKDAGSTLDGSGDRNSSGAGPGRRREPGADSATDQNGRPLSPSTQWAVQRAAPILTGNAEADADIIAFYKAREKLLSNARLSGTAAPQSAQGGRQ